MAIYSPDLAEVEPRTAQSPNDQIADIAKAFSLTPSLTPGLHWHADMKKALLGSYCEWLFYELRLASKELYPGEPCPERYTPQNTRWGEFHFRRRNWPEGSDWRDLPTPLSRAALVLWAVGAIDDITDPLRDTIRRLRDVEAAIDGAGRDVEEGDPLFDEMIALLDRITDNPIAPTTMLGAAEALQFVVDRLDLDMSTERSAAVIGAVIQFLKREEPQA